MNKLNKNKTNVTLIICIILLTILSTTAYSAFSSTMNISGISYSRMQSDIRITNLKVENISSNIVIEYNEYSKNTISTKINLPYSDSFITYEIEVTNYGSNEMGILSIDGLPCNLEYELINYNLKDKICNENNKCTNYAKKTFFLKIKSKNYDANNTSHEMNLFFKFKPFYNVTYINLNNSNNYPFQVLGGDTLKISFNENNYKGIIVYRESKLTNNYQYKDQIIEIPDIESDIKIEGINYNKNYGYTGKEEILKIEYSGIYTIETWGAQGGVIDSTKYGGYGGYSIGDIYLQKNDILYINVGGQGSKTTGLQAETPGGYNGGGNAISSYTNSTSSVASGGGATSVSFVSGLLETLSNNIPDIISVSGGGGGYFYDPVALSYGTVTVGHGGGMEGTEASSKLASSTANRFSPGGTQTSGHAFGKGSGCALGGECGGGGGGFYGGNKVSYTGAGGSGYIGNNELFNKHMTCYNCKTSNDENTKTLSTTNVSETATSDYAKKGSGYVKIVLKEMYKLHDEDIEITNISVAETNKATSSNESYTTNKILADINFEDNSSYIIYKIDITNHGSRTMGITNIINQNNNLQYEFTNYTLNNKLCNSNNKCNNEITSTVYIKITGQSGTHKLNLDLEFNPFYNINYINIKNNSYPKEILSKGTLQINIKENDSPGILVYKDNMLYQDYSYKNGILTIPNIVSDIDIEAFSYKKEYSYTGKEEILKVEYSGIYRLETWGAQGGVIDSTRYGGYGGYSTGNIHLKENTQLYINVGGQGGKITGLQAEVAGGYNGGGNGITSFNTKECTVASGGGATSISLVSGILSTLSNNISDIIIVSGGGGGYYYDPEQTTYGTYSIGHGGGFEGGSSSDKVATTTPKVTSPGGTQTTGHAFGQGSGCLLGAECGGSGGGFYGGSRGSYTGSGGSGYIGNSLLINKKMVCYNCKTSAEESTKTISTTNVSPTPTSDYAKKGSGYVKITLIEMIKE